MVEDPDGDYVYYGSYTLSGWLNSAGSFSGAKEGKLTLKLKDGSKYEFTQHPQLLVTGLIQGPQVSTYCKHAIINDLDNGLTVDMHYNPWEDNSYSGMMKSAIKWGFGKKKKKKEGEVVKRKDDVHVTIFKT